MPEKKLGIKELLVNCVLIADFRHSFLKDPDGFLKKNPAYSISEEQLSQIKAYKMETWDEMKLKDLDDWLIKAGEISRPGSVSVSVP